MEKRINPIEIGVSMKPKDLIDHPEGGRCREVYRSKSLVHTHKGQNRCALTHIYFELRADEISHFHRVRSDEVWNLYAGHGLYLYLWDGSEKTAERVELSTKSRQFCFVVPRGVWQAAVPIDDDILVGCSVAPGFEVEDFEMLEPTSEDAVRLCLLNPEMKQMIKASGHP